VSAWICRRRRALRDGYGRVKRHDAREAPPSSTGLPPPLDGQPQESAAAARERQKAFEGGAAIPDFSRDASIRAGDWQVAPIPAD